LKRWLCGTAAALLVIGLAGCGGKDDNTGSTTAQADSGATLTLWTRAATESISKAYASLL
jgi:multiple sugar transport system substrate-binding protein